MSQRFNTILVHPEFAVCGPLNHLSTYSNFISGSCCCWRRRCFVCLWLSAEPSASPAKDNYRMNRYKNKALNPEEMRRRREEEGIQLRKQKREQQVSVLVTKSVTFTVEMMFFFVFSLTVCFVNSSYLRGGMWISLTKRRQCLRVLWWTLTLPLQ